MLLGCQASTSTEAVTQPSAESDGVNEATTTALQLQAPGMLPGGPVCDAGDEAYVRRVVPQLWGRHPHSVREVALLMQIIEQSDRDTLIGAMMQSDEIVRRWAEFIKDHLQVNRTGERVATGSTWAESPLDGGALASFVRDNPPTGPAYQSPWGVADLIESAIFLQDLSPVFRAQLFAMLGSKIINLDNPGANLAWRQVYGDIFERSYLNRRMECLQCHNSEYSVTGSSDPALDRSLEVPGYFEKALFGDS